MNPLCNIARTFGTDNEPYYDSLWNSTGSFTLTQFQLATEMVASAWYSAWVDAGRPWLGVAGDYNNDAAIDAADYVTSRKYQGTSATLPNDETPGVVGQADYTRWRTNFGKSRGLSSGGSANTPIPEPLSLWLMVMFVAGPRRIRRNSGRRRRRRVDQKT